MEIRLRSFETVEIIAKNDRLVIFSDCNGVLNSQRESIEPTKNKREV